MKPRISLGLAAMPLARYPAAAAAAPPRPQGPCDIYAATGTPCAAAHSTTRALYASYNGPLYQVLRQSDGKTLDIGVVKPLRLAGARWRRIRQRELCRTRSVPTPTAGSPSSTISPRSTTTSRRLPRGAFSGPAMGGFNNLPLADMAPVTIMGHKAYGVFIEPGMGMRHNDAKGTAVDDQAEGQYWVINGQHLQLRLLLRLRQRRDRQPR